MINSSHLKAFFSNPANKRKMQQAMYNTSKGGYSKDHVSNRDGRNFLAVKFRGGRFEITDRFYNDVTELVKSFMINPLMQIVREGLNGLRGATTNNKSIAKQLGIRYTKNSIAYLEGVRVDYIAYAFDELGNIVVITRDKLIKQFIS